MPTAENVLARLLQGVPVPTSEVDALPEPGREIARRVASANGDGALAAFDAALADFVPDTAARDGGDGKTTPAPKTDHAEPDKAAQNASG